jgi:hypothetical protein
MRHGRFSSSVLVALAVSAALAAPAAASGSKGPRYSLRISSGETTFPEWESPDSTSGSVEPSTSLAVSIIRGGVTVYRDVGSGGAWLSQVPQGGDVVRLEAPVGTIVGQVVYDGLPAIDPTVCAGSTNFSGSNSLGEVVEGYFVNKVLRYNNYGVAVGTQQVKGGFGEAQVKSLTGTTFGGSFLTPLAIGEDVGAIETLKTPLPGEGTYTYTSETERPVSSCPAPPPVVKPPAPPVLQGTLGRMLHASIHALLKAGLRDTVTINQAGTVVQDLYAKGGSVPAFASATRHHKPPPAMLLARGSATAKAAGHVTVVLHATKRGRQRLHSAHNIVAVLITTLRSTGGARLNLQRHTLTLHR